MPENQNGILRLSHPKLIALLNTGWNIVPYIGKRYESLKQTH